MKYVGANPVNSTDVATLGYVNSLGAANLSQSTVNTMITNALTGYVTKTYVDTQDALNATPAFVDAGDAAKLHLAQINNANGVAGLDATGRVPVARINRTGSQRWPKPYYTPSTYFASDTTYNGSAGGAVNEQVIYTYSLPDPGMTYRLLVFGSISYVPQFFSSDALGVSVFSVHAGGTPILHHSGFFGDSYTFANPPIAVGVGNQIGVDGTRGSSGSNAGFGQSGTSTDQATIIPSSLENQTPLTGAQTIYVTTGQDFGSTDGLTTAHAFRPSLFIVPVGA